MYRFNKKSLSVEDKTRIDQINKYIHFLVNRHSYSECWDIVEALVKRKEKILNGGCW